MWGSLLANWIYYIAAKKPQPLCEIETKRELEKQGKCGHRLIMHSITRRGEIWEVGGEWSEKIVGGRGWAAPLCQLIYEPGEMVWQYIYFPTLLKKGLLLKVIRIRGTAETRRCDADAVRLQVITWNPPLTLCASYLPLFPPPPAPPLVLRVRLLSSPLLI